MVEPLHAAIEMPTRLRAIDEVREWASRHVGEAGLDEEVAFAVEIALAEALANVVLHSFGGEPHHVVPVTLDIDQHEARITIRDRGEPFDPRPYRRPNLDEASAGGYGVYLIDKVMDEVIREPTNDGTVITLVKRRTIGGR